MYRTSYSLIFLAGKPDCSLGFPIYQLFSHICSHITDIIFLLQTIYTSQNQQVQRALQLLHNKSQMKQFPEKLYQIYQCIIVFLKYWPCIFSLIQQNNKQIKMGIYPPPSPACILRCKQKFDMLSYFLHQFFKTYTKETNTPTSVKLNVHYYNL